MLSPDYVVLKAILNKLEDPTSLWGSSFIWDPQKKNAVRWIVYF